MRGPERDRAALEDILRYVGDVRSHTAAGRQVMSEGLTRHAVLWELAIIGEAANRLTQEFREAHPELPWRRIVNQRNFLVHGYDRVDADLVWDAIGRLPEVQAYIEAMLEEMGEP